MTNNRAKYRAQPSGVNNMTFGHVRFQTNGEHT